MPGLTPRLLKRVGEAVRQVERQRPGPSRSRVNRTPTGSRVLVKTTVAHNKGQTQPCEIYRGTTKGSETATGEEIDCYNRYADLESDKWARAEFVDGGWELYCGEC